MNLEEEYEHLKLINNRCVCDELIKNFEKRCKCDEIKDLCTECERFFLNPLYYCCYYCFNDYFDENYNSEDEENEIK